MLKPTLELELLKNFPNIIGLDEVGRGCLAGPVVAAAVCFYDFTEISGIRDSKKIAAKKRERISLEIKERAHIGVGVVGPDDIDKINILQASFLAMKKGIQSLDLEPSYLLIDGGFALPGVSLPQRAIKQGDDLCYSIAAASIIAKVYRDRLMVQYSEKYPYYSFETNVGYGTKVHLEALKSHGVTPIHRKSFKGVKELVAL